jgi:glycosyltransferase involved in cell wall biosynthesis
VAPFFSIVIPVHNRVSCLIEAIRSVLIQKVENYEILVIDDGSTDDIASAVASFKHSSLNYYRLPDNQGVTSARNFGIVKANGKYICFLDSDDVFMPNKLSVLYELHIKHEAEQPVFMYGGWEWMNFETNRVRAVRQPDKSGLIEGWPRWCYNIVPDMVERNFIQTHLFNKDLKSYELFELLIQLFKDGRTVFTTEIISRYRDHTGERVSSNIKNSLHTIDYLFQNHLEFIEQVPTFCARMKLTSALYKKKLGFSGYRKDLVKSIDYNPWEPRTYYHLLKSLV